MALDSPDAQSVLQAKALLVERANTRVAADTDGDREPAHPSTVEEGGDEAPAAQGQITTRWLRTDGRRVRKWGPDVVSAPVESKEGRWTEQRLAMAICKLVEREEISPRDIFCHWGGEGSPGFFLERAAWLKGMRSLLNNEEIWLSDVRRIANSIFQVLSKPRGTAKVRVLTLGDFIKWMAASATRGGRVVDKEGDSLLALHEGERRGWTNL
jgi:hypothetical protein